MHWTLSRTYCHRPKALPVQPGRHPHALLEGAVQRIRPKLMTVAAILFGLLPIMWGSGSGSDVMKRIAAPMIGGVISSFVLELLIYPILFAIWKGKEVDRLVAQPVMAPVKEAV